MAEQQVLRTTLRLRWRLRVGMVASALALPLAAMAQQAFTRAGVSLMAGPGNSYPVVAMLGEGQPVDVMGCTRGYGWCDVMLPDGLRGWLYAPVLEYPYQGAPVPLPGYAAIIGVPIITFSIGSYWGRYYRDRPWYPEPRWWGGHAPPPPMPGWRPPAPVRPSWQPHPGPPPPNFRPPTPVWQPPRPDHGVRPPRDPGMHPPGPGVSVPNRPPNVGHGGGGRQWDNNQGGHNDRGNHGGPQPGQASLGGPQHDRGSNAGPPPNRGGGGGGDHGQGRGGGGGGGGDRGQGNHGNHGNRGGGDKDH